MFQDVGQNFYTFFFHVFFFYTFFFFKIKIFNFDGKLTIKIKFCKNKGKKITKICVKILPNALKSRVFRKKTLIREKNLIVEWTFTMKKLHLKEQKKKEQIRRVRKIKSSETRQKKTKTKGTFRCFGATGSSKANQLSKVLWPSCLGKDAWIFVKIILLQ